MDISLKNTFQDKRSDTDIFMPKSHLSVELSLNNQASLDIPKHTGQGVFISKLISCLGTIRLVSAIQQHSIVARAGWAGGGIFPCFPLLHVGTDVSLF